MKAISDSKKLSQLKTDGARLLYTWLLPHLDVNGCFSGDAQVIKGRVFTRLKKSVKVVESYLQELEKNKLIVRYQSNGDIFLNVPDFVEKQPQLNPNKEASPTIPLPTPELLQSYSRVTPPQVKESKVKESKGKKTGNNFSSDFEKLWEYYPRKIEKQKAYKAFVAREKGGASFNQMFLAVKNYAANCRKRGIDKEYIKYPATFLGPDKPYLDWLREESEPYCYLSDGSPIATKEELQQLDKEGKIEWYEREKVWKKVAL